jgi:hypothetical protein
MTPCILLVRQVFAADVAACVYEAALEALVDTLEALCRLGRWARPAHGTGWEAPFPPPPPPIIMCHGCCRVT